MLARLTLLTTIAALAACAGGQTNGVLELQLGTVNAPDSLINATSEEFAQRVNERLNGQVAVTVFGSSQLGSDEVMMQKLRLGTLGLSVPSTIMSSFVPEFGLFEMPYLVEDREHMRRIGEEIFWPEIAPLAEAQGYKILALWENGFRHITNNVRPIRVPADLAGIKLRTPRGEWRVRLFQVFGANPTPMGLSEVFVALQTGVIDGQENPIAQVTSLRLQEVQRYLSLTGHVYTPSYLAMGLESWNRLPADVQDVMLEVGREVQDFAYAEGARSEAALLDTLRTQGIEINDADRQRFLEASQPIYAEFGRRVAGGDALISAAVDLAAR